MANRTMSPEIAATLRATISERRSFIVMAVPRLAGKTTVMNAMLAELPKGAPVKRLGYDGEDIETLVQAARGGYFIVPEIARGPWAPGYVNGEPVRRAFHGIAMGTPLATALHAPDPETAFTFICRDNDVPDEDASRIALVVYLRSLGPQETPTRRVVATVHEVTAVRDGRPRTRLLFRWNQHADKFEKVEEPDRIGRGGQSGRLRV